MWSGAPRPRLWATYLAAAGRALSWAWTFFSQAALNRDSHPDATSFLRIGQVVGPSVGDKSVTARPGSDPPRPIPAEGSG